MRKALVALAAAAVLTGCGGGDGGTSAEETAASEAAEPTVDPEEYADGIVEAFRGVRTPGLEHYDVPTSDWAAFVAVVEDMGPPRDEALDHERMVAGFQAYVDARQEQESLCAGVDWNDPGWAACGRAASAVSDTWVAALDRAYEIPGLSYATLIS